MGASPFGLIWQGQNLFIGETPFFFTLFLISHKKVYTTLAPDDDFVQTEWNYLLMKKAAQFPSNTSAHEWFHEGYDGLLDQIDQRGSSDAQPYHILGSQTLAWVHAASLTVTEKRTILHGALEAVKVGAKKHFRSTELKTLSKDLETEWLMTSAGE